VPTDARLITALAERWREETHTFHLPIGEVTVTLEDVVVPFGLPIDGIGHW
jgi:Plant mobile domain